MRARPATDRLPFPFFERLTNDARRELGALPRTRAPGGRRLLRRGDPTNGAYLVVAGELRVYYIAESGREATLYRVDPGGTCVLALGATFEDAPYPAWVDAGAAGVELLRVPPPLFHRLLETDSAFRAFIFGAMSGRLFELMSTLEEIGSVQIEERVARFLLRRRQPGGNEIRVSQSAIASELGTAREVVFRALRSLVGRGYLRTGRTRVVILDVAGLTAFSRP